MFFNLRISGQNISFINGTTKEKVEFLTSYSASELPSVIQTKVCDSRRDVEKNIFTTLQTLQRSGGEI